ncbi:MAG: branched-chain amino acid ABC transporter permease [Alphaproteobacteria bacterium]|nr:MAG: branched-chain amino acid ABC transporter permease [Alphaproteobacteria bacterium]
MEVAQLLLGGISVGCVYGLVALGFVLIYKATESVNFAQGDLMMLGAFITLQFVNTAYWGLPFWLGVLLAVLVMAVVGYLMEALVIRRLFGQPQFAVVILTIAIGFVLRFAAGFIWGHEPLTLETPFAGRNVALGRLVIGVDEIFVIGATVVLTGTLYLFFARTRLGVAMQAASQNQLAAYYMGVPVKRIHGLIWALSGGIATIAGVLFASRGSIDPNLGLLGIKAFAAAVIGGFGSLPGALAGGLIVGIVEPFAGRYIAAGYSQIMPYAIMLVVLVLRPNGLFAQVQSKKV